MSENTTGGVKLNRHEAGSLGDHQSRPSEAHNCSRTPSWGPKGPQQAPNRSHGKSPGALQGHKKGNRPPSDRSPGAAFSVHRHGAPAQIRKLDKKVISDKHLFIKFAKKCRSTTPVHKKVHHNRPTGRGVEPKSTRNDTRR